MNEFKKLFSLALEELDIATLYLRESIIALVFPVPITPCIKLPKHYYCLRT